MSTKPCVAKGRRECVRGFHRDLCTKCDMGARSCNVCSHTQEDSPNVPRVHISHSAPASPRSSFDDIHHHRRASSSSEILSSSAPSASSPCFFCYNGQRECDECFGVGYVQRVCRDCIRAHYRRQEEETKSGSVLKKAKHQIYETQQQFSRSLISLTSSRPSSPSLSPSSSTLAVQEEQQQQRRQSSQSDDDQSVSDCSMNDSQSKLKSVGSSLRLWTKTPVKAMLSKSSTGTRKWSSWSSACA